MLFGANYESHYFLTIKLNEYTIQFNLGGPSKNIIYFPLLIVTDGLSIKRSRMRKSWFSIQAVA